MGDARLTGPITVALVNDYELVLRGLVGMLSPFQDRITVIELNVDSDPVSPVDVALFDAYGHARLGLDRVKSLTHCTNVGAVAVYTSYATAEHCADALESGVRGVLSKSMRADELADALFAIADGSQVVSDNFGDGSDDQWPGHDFGLTPRESRVAALLGRGHEQQRDCSGLVGQRAHGEDALEGDLPENHGNLAVAGDRANRW